MNRSSSPHDALPRRRFMQLSLGACAAGALGSMSWSAMFHRKEKALFEISLAQWSLHRATFDGDLDAIDFPRTAKQDYDIDAVEYVNSFYKDHVRDQKHWTDLKQRADDAGVRSLLIMIDGEGLLGDPDEARRIKTIDNHRKWVEVAKFLGCHSIRVNAGSSGSAEEQSKLVVDGLSRLTEFAAPHEINVLVENHGGLSSNGAWLASVMAAVNHPRCGTLPDFGNFCLDWDRKDDPDAWYDRYRGVRELMPFARAVSAKSHDFDDQGNELRTDYRRMMKIVLEAGYRGFVGVEYEGDDLSEPDGIRATKKLLEVVRDEFAANPALVTTT